MYNEIKTLYVYYDINSREKHLNKKKNIEI